MSKKLGIIAGGGDIPKALIEKCKEQNRDYFVVAIEGNADKNLIDETIPHVWIRLGQAGTGFKKLAEEKVEEVVMIGTIRRPSFKDLIPDLRTTAFFTRLGFKSIGDDVKIPTNIAKDSGIRTNPSTTTDFNILTNPGESLNLDIFSDAGIRMDIG